MSRIYALSIHADYRCRHSGACCTAGWPIPVERETFARLDESIRWGTLGIDGAETVPAAFVAAAGAPAETPVVTAVRPDGSCIFYERGTGLCAIHRQAGAALLPVSCRQFPRVSLLDDRGLFVNLSHYCPTAAHQLFRDDVALRIVEAPPAFPVEFPYEPLDARSAIPPLLKPDVLLDLETFGRWESAVIEALGDDRGTPDQSVLAVAKFTEALRAWRPGAVTLERHFDESLATTGPKSFFETSGACVPEPGPVPFDRVPTFRDYALVLEAIPRECRPHVPLDRAEAAYGRWVGGRWAGHSAAVRRYLATKIFGSWLAYQGRGLRTMVYSLAVALSVLKVNVALECHQTARPADNGRLVAAIRRTDELLVHLASRQELARRLSTIEKGPPLRAEPNDVP